MARSSKRPALTGRKPHVSRAQQLRDIGRRRTARRRAASFYWTPRTSPSKDMAVQLELAEEWAFAEPGDTLTVRPAAPVLLVPPAITLSRCVAVIDTWSAFLPQCIVNEEVGDYVEDLHRRAVAGQRVQLWARVLACLFYTTINAAGYALGELRRNRRDRKGA